MSASSSESSATVLIQVVDGLMLFGLFLALLGHPYVDLDLAFDIPIGGDAVWQADAPITDVVALLMLPVVLLRARLAGGQGPRRPPLPGALGWGVLLLAALASLGNHPEPLSGLHEVVRRPLFAYVAYGVGFAWAVSLLGDSRWLRPAVLTALGVSAVVSLVTSAARLGSGDGLWFHPLSGLTPNHKTIAVCLAGWTPLLLNWARGERPSAARLVAGLVGLAVLASASKTAVLGVGLAGALAWPVARPLAWRPVLFGALVAAGVALAYYSPLLLSSRTMLDAARSRHSLNERAWLMTRTYPLRGAGFGMSTRTEMVTFPHYRINGVDAHGAIQKVAGETGALGLAGLGLFVTGSALGLRRRWQEQQADSAVAGTAAQASTRLPAYACFSTFIVLHGQLMLSTELFNATHWVPLATCWGLAWTSATRDRCAS